jgi:hypothetical protein
VLRGDTHYPDKVLSVFESHTEAIRKGKATKRTEFGKLVKIQEAEAQFIARLEHPHVVPLYDYWREPGGAYLVMRFLRGGNLAEALDDGAFELERAARVGDFMIGIRERNDGRHAGEIPAAARRCGPLGPADIRAAGGADRGADGIAKNDFGLAHAFLLRGK